MTTIVPPTERTCERCGRTDVWNDDRGSWVVATDDDGTRITGEPFCLHEWDINGAYSPLEGGA